VKQKKGRKIDKDDEVDSVSDRGRRVREREKERKWKRGKAKRNLSHHPFTNTT
jgi:hypothetical protein